MTGRILVVDDERAQRDALARYLGRAGFEVEAVATGEDAVSALVTDSWNILITDLRLPGIDGLEVVRRAREIDEELGVLLITAYASVDSAVDALRIGAHDYLLKPLILEEVARKVVGLIEHRQLIQENLRLRRALQQGSGEIGVEITAESGPMREVQQWIARAARTRATVLITGETGTGKEVTARSIHRLGSAADEPFLAVNLAAVPENLVESELFGHERGAFTGAERKREGILRAAAGGTVFLDEIAELPVATQAKLLRALEEHEVQPLGTDHSVPFEARIIAATHREPQKMIDAGRLREDLFYRLNVLRIILPPLRDRQEDIPALAHVILDRQCARHGMASPLVTAEAMRALCRHSWRGNVRELSNVLERALILADEGRIDLEQLPGDVRGTEIVGMDLQAATEQFERSHISMALRLAHGNREKAAHDLGVSLATLYRRIEKLGLKGFEVHRGAVAEIL